MAATLRDVARVADVSIKTASNVVNDYPHVRPATRQRVLEAIEQLNYRPNMTARSLRMGRTGVICLAVAELRQTYHAELADAVIRAAAARGLVVTVEQTNGTRARELELLNSPRLHGTDGLILVPLEIKPADLVVAPVPVVLLSEAIFDGPVDHVTMENSAGARAATEHLISVGRRDIALIGARGEPHHHGAEPLRTQAYRDALDAAGIPFREELVVETGPWHRGTGAEAVRELLERRVRFDAVFGLNDDLALGAMRQLVASGLRVPEDVAVVGFDDLDASQYSVPTLTTIDPGVDQMAEAAVRVLTERIEQPADEPATPQKIEVPFRLVQRESTAVPAALPVPPRHARTSALRTALASVRGSVSGA